ncbi:uncharacterized protein BXZ73DRAFT_104587 [Epithele typhae]|uniref:uncharacterized protein n=1 Tax=Epithele typhae TaxID=378194 RepID=UPI002007E610|nr:uncharacterized protein BXZ73DRAFT_104587 [Epithele typhae]KAH9920853.1 hypothetical protein BXZ73DRAFT_104587 [Epithele typhae]
MSQIPWNRVSIDTLRAVMDDLGLAAYTSTASSHELVKLIRKVETDGVDAVANHLNSLHGPSRPSAAAHASISISNPADDLDPESDRVAPPPVYAAINAEYRAMGTYRGPRRTDQVFDGVYIETRPEPARKAAARDWEFSKEFLGPKSAVQTEWSRRVDRIGLGSMSTRGRATELRGG